MVERLPVVMAALYSNVYCKIGLIRGTPDVIVLLSSGQSRAKSAENAEMCRDYIPDPDLIGNKIVQTFGNKRISVRRRL